jgi:hypothetical protein
VFFLFKSFFRKLFKWVLGSYLNKMILLRVMEKRHILVSILVFILLIAIGYFIYTFPWSPVETPGYLSECPEPNSTNCTLGWKTLWHGECPERICLEDYDSYCESSGGKGKFVGDLECGDECDSSVVCSGLYDTCDCGPGKCWNEETLSCIAD